jgi:endonuclease-8
MLTVAPDRLRRLEGATVTAVEANGKHLLVRFDSGLVLHSHMRMTGSWHLYRPGEAWRKPARLARAVLGTDDTVAVLFSAPVVELLREREAAAELAHLGPDILAPELDLPEILRRVRTSERQPLGELLLDQRVAAGIGNIYKCESLFRLRLDPWRPASGLSDEKVAAVFLQSRELMLGALRGRVPHLVHGRTGRGCPRCSGRIACRRQGIPPRFTYFCSTCQRTGLR